MGGGRLLRELLQDIDASNKKEFKEPQRSPIDELQHQVRDRIQMTFPLPPQACRKPHGPKQQQRTLDEKALRKVREQRLQLMGEEEKRARLRHQDRFRAVQKRLQSLWAVMTQHQAVLVRGLPASICEKKLFQVVLEQAGFWGDRLAGFEVDPGAGTHRGTAVIKLTSREMAENCIQHFLGCRWGLQVTSCLLPAGGQDGTFLSRPPGHFFSEDSNSSSCASSFCRDRGRGDGSLGRPLQGASTSGGSTEDAAAEDVPCSEKSIAWEMENAIAEHTDLVLEALLSPSEFEPPPPLASRRVALGPPGMETSESAVLSLPAEAKADESSEREEAVMMQEANVSASAKEVEDDRSTRSGSSRSGETLM